MAAARVFRVEFRIAVARRILNGERVSALSNELKIKRSVLYRWGDAYREQGEAGLNRARGRPPAETGKAIPKAAAGPAAEQRIAELEQRLGRMALENDFQFAFVQFCQQQFGLFLYRLRHGEHRHRCHSRCARTRIRDQDPKWMKVESLTRVVGFSRVLQACLERTKPLERSRPHWVRSGPDSPGRKQLIA
jgi:transposase-like protein